MRLRLVHSLGSGRTRGFAVAASIALLGLLAMLFAVGAQATEGTVMSWGVNETGQLGDGTTSSGAGCRCKSSPVAVTISDATQVSGSYYHAVALRSDGSVKAWGYNAYGELGNGTTTDSNSPVDVGGISNAVAVAAGYYHSIALLADGTVVAWGDNEKGELGQGTTTGPEACATYPCSKTPIPVPGLSNGPRC